MDAKITCGRFTFDSTTSEIEGPGQYMREQGNALMDAIMSGNDTVFNMTGHLSPSPEMAVLVRLQTDYAGWAGNQQILNWLGGANKGKSRTADLIT